MQTVQNNREPESRAKRSEYSTYWQTVDGWMDG